MFIKSYSLENKFVPHYCFYKDIYFIPPNEVKNSLINYRQIEKNVSKFFY